MFTNDKTIAAIIAVPNPVTWKPGTIALMIIRSNALMTNVNNPNVKIVIGSVNTRSIGFTSNVKIPQTIAITTSACQPLTLNPGTIYAVT